MFKRPLKTLCSIMAAGSIIPLKKTLKLKIILQHIRRRVICSVLVQISPTIIFCTLLLLTRILASVSTNGLTLPMLRLYFHPKHKRAKIFGNHRNPVILVFIG